MKQLLFLLFTSIGILNAQTSIGLTIQSNSMSVMAGDTIDLITSDSSLVTETIDITNNSASTQTYNVKRYDLVLHQSSKDTAEAYFCFGGCCFGPDSLKGFCPAVVLSGQSTGTMGAFFSLAFDLQEAKSKGFSLVKYTIFNETQTNDTLQFVARYNKSMIGLGLAEQAGSRQSFSFWPNPATNEIQLRLNEYVQQAVTVSLTSILGNCVYHKQIQVESPHTVNSIYLGELDAGFYTLNIESGGITRSKKIQIINNNQ